MAKLNIIFVEEGFVGVCLDWRPLNIRCFVINVYFKCDLEAKMRLWEKLLEVKYGLGMKCGVSLVTSMK